MTERPFQRQGPPRLARIHRIGRELGHQLDILARWGWDEVVEPGDEADMATPAFRPRMAGGVGQALIAEPRLARTRSVEPADAGEKD